MVSLKARTEFSEEKVFAEARMTGKSDKSGSEVGEGSSKEW